jgi:NAD(P)-dependent dehydrogenase (short-subunit alcohol dehydrogenase family)
MTTNQRVGSGLGRETAYTFAEHGATGVAFADINEETARKNAEFSKTIATSKEYRAIVIQVDIADRKSVKTGVEAALKEFGRIDFAVNSAGVRLNNARTASFSHILELFGE